MNLDGNVDSQYTHRVVTSITDMDDGSDVPFRYVKEFYVPRPAFYKWDKWKIGQIIRFNIHDQLDTKYIDTLLDKKLHLEVFQPTYLPKGGRGVRLLFPEEYKDRVEAWWNKKPIILHMHFLESIDENEVDEYMRKNPTIHKDSITVTRNNRSIYDERYTGTSTCPIWYLCNTKLGANASLKYETKKDKSMNEIRCFTAKKPFRRYVEYEDGFGYIDLTWYYGPGYKDHDGNPISYI